MKTPYKLSENTFDHNEINAVKNILDNNFNLKDEQYSTYLASIYYDLPKDWIVKFDFGNKIIDSKRIFLGTMIGDFSRISISTSINTGTFIGLGSNIFNHSFNKKFFIIVTI